MRFRPVSGGEADQGIEPHELDIVAPASRLGKAGQVSLRTDYRKAGSSFWPATEKTTLSTEAEKEMARIVVNEGANGRIGKIANLRQNTQ